jgi:hypothetical protein
MPAARMRERVIERGKKEDKEETEIHRFRSVKISKYL